VDVSVWEFVADSEMVFVCEIDPVGVTEELSVRVAVGDSDIVTLIEGVGVRVEVPVCVDVGVGVGVCVMLGVDVIEIVRELLSDADVLIVGVAVSVAV
jgi:hypothetical protein